MATLRLSAIMSAMSVADPNLPRHGMFRDLGLPVILFAVVLRLVITSPLVCARSSWTFER